jgi:cytochrome c2
MVRAFRFAPLFGLAAAALFLTGGVAQAQGTGMTVNPALAQRGKSVFSSKGCTGCHTVGKGKAAGPDLLGVTERRTPEWLKQWLHAPESMFDSDSTAKALLDAAKGTKMPNMHLNDADIDALMNYLAQETEQKKK